MEFVTILNRKKCKKIYKAVRSPIVLYLLYFEIFFAWFCCRVLFYPDKEYGMIIFMVIATVYFILVYVLYGKKTVDQMCPKEAKNGEYAQKVEFKENEIVISNDINDLMIQLEYSRISKCYVKKNFWIFVSKGKFFFAVDRNGISQEDREKLRAFLKVKLPKLKV